MSALKPLDIVQKMMDKDWFSQWLEIEVQELREGYCRCSLKVRKDMLNGFSIAHGGVTYSLADSTLAFAANSFGRMAVSVETSISHYQATKEGDQLIAETELIHQTHKMMYFLVHVRNETGVRIALMKGTMYVRSSTWD
jgi:acyl-CoA thioesterase